MDADDELTARFEEQRAHLQAVAHRLLGSRSDAEDAVQETWLRLRRTDAREIENLGGWLTTVVSRVSLSMLRARRTRREDALELHAPDPVVGPPAGEGPEGQALTADAVGLALLVVLDTLTPAERLAFVLHDVFALPFGDVAAVIERSPEAARQLASRARRRVRSAAPEPDSGPVAQREVVDAFFAAARTGSFEALVAVLDPDVVLRADFGAGRVQTVTGADAVAGRALLFASPTREVRPATVNGAVGVVVVEDGRAFSVMAFTAVGGRVARIDALGDPERLARLVLEAPSR